MFSAIVIDPPWRYDNVATRGAAEDHYQTMDLDGLARTQPDAQVHGCLRICIVMRGKRHLDGNRAIDRVGDGHKGSHEPVASVFDLAAAKIS